MNWKDFCLLLMEDAGKKTAPASGVYPASVISHGEKSWFFAVKDHGEKFLAAVGDSLPYRSLKGEEENYRGTFIKKCPMDPHNRDVMAEYFPFMNPVNHRGTDITIGLGDRLGLASGGHIGICAERKVFPVLAQQSIRELNLTGRNYREVLSDASWAVFTRGFKDGFGADGDHLKSKEEVKMALDCGFTMITLDCSEHINNGVYSYTKEEIRENYQKIGEDKRLKLEEKYSGKSIKIDGELTVDFPRDEFMKTLLVYFNAIEFTEEIYRDVILKSGKKVDFEMSVDETLYETSVRDHYFVASELIERGVEVTSLAPRFCGEFQKGIDYMGDTDLFEKEFTSHFKIAQYFGYKISVHSGSDKFKIFPAVGRITGGKYHLKTAGTNWLVAMEVVALRDPDLYRKIHKFALSRLEEAKKYYHIKGRAENVEDIDSLTDEELVRLFGEDDARQIIHITYGLILSEKDEGGRYVFRDAIYGLLFEYEEDYDRALELHIGKHFDYLGII